MTNHSIASKDSTVPITSIAQRVSTADTLSWRQLIAKTIIAAGDQASMSAASFITGVLINRSCGTSALGYYYLLFNVIILIECLQRDLIDAPFILRGPQLKHFSRLYFAGSTWIFFLLFALTGSTVVGIVSLTRYWPTATPQVLHDFWLIALTLPAVLLRRHLRQRAYAMNQVLLVTSMGIIAAVLQIAAIAVLHYLSILTVPMVMYIIFGACLSSAAIWYIGYYGASSFSIRRIKRDWQANWHMSRWFLCSTVCVLGSTQCILWMMKYHGGEQDVAKYGAANSTAGILSLVIIGSSNVIAPALARTFATLGIIHLNKAIIRFTGLLWCAMIAPTITMVMCGGIILSWLYGEDHSQSGIIITMLSLSVFISVLNVTIGTALNVIGKMRYGVIADAINCSATIAIGYATIMTCGAFGAALATLLGITAGCCVRIYYWTNIMSNKLYIATTKVVCDGT